MIRSATPEVLVVGAGPTGLSLAITLRRLGIAVRVVDRAGRPSAVSKALAMWSGSLEALHGMEVVDAFLAAGQRLRALSVGQGGRELASLPVGAGIDSPYPFPLLLPQSRTEAILGARLEALGVAVERGVELTGLAQDAAGVTADLRHADGRVEAASVGYLVGCDGARSAVRHALGVAFEGYTEPGVYLLGDVRVDGGDLDQRSIYLRWNRGGAVALFPFGDAVWRVFAEREPASAAPDDAPPTLAELQAHLDRFGPPGIRLRDPGWLSAFRINERLAARYRVGRCFLAGDAAHIHSPAGGQGMNTGIQDAVNLGWKLGYALRGAGDTEVLLDSYEPERRPIARAVIDGSARRLHVAFHRGDAARLARNLAVSALGRIPAVQRKLQVDLSETEIVYRDGPLVALGGAPRRAGRTRVGGRARDARFRDADGAERRLWPELSALRHCLLVFEDAGRPMPLERALDRAGDRVAVLRLDPARDPGLVARTRYRQRGPGWVLIRPDQVVAARGTEADLARLDRYLDGAVRARPDIPLDEV